jgi:hypothetical protein
MTTLTILHPGAIGAKVGGHAPRSGARVLYVPTGRGPASLQRAQEAGMEAAESLEPALAASDVVLSVCPPYAAQDVAHEVLTHPFPRRVRRGQRHQPGPGASPPPGRSVTYSCSYRIPPAYRRDQQPTTARKDQ